MVKLAENDDAVFMKAALNEAKMAGAKGEIPVGAVVVCDKKIIARSHNLTETLTDPTAHAEMQAITAANSYLGGKYLDRCTIYVTLEPCTMCAGALFWSRIGRLVYGTDDKKRGYSINTSPVLHNKTIVEKGVMEQECRSVLQEFFKTKRY